MVTPPFVFLETEEQAGASAACIQGQHRAGGLRISDCRFQICDFNGRVRLEFDDGAVAPSVLCSREVLNGAEKVGIAFRAEDTGTGGKALAGDADVDFWMSAQVQQPVRSIVLGNDVETALALGKPDFNFARMARNAPLRGEIEVLLAVYFTGL